ncbi:hypothetical protein LUU34_00744100 [Aix galericulata]|nr:hypothetical protein LUU34_00744100 [Aix galericulata]
MREGLIPRCSSRQLPDILLPFCWELSSSSEPPAPPLVSPVIRYPMLSNITSRGSAFIRLWFAWEAPSMSTTTRPLRVSLCKTRRERTQQDRARNKELLQPSRDPRRNKPYNWVNATGGQEAVTGMRLETIHNRLVSLQHSNKVGGFFLPDEEGAVIRPTDYVLCIARWRKAEELEFTDALADGFDERRPTAEAGMKEREGKSCFEWNIKCPRRSLPST